MSDNYDSKGIVVTGVIGDDVHVVGIRILEHALKRSGFKVVALGVQVSQEDFINAAIETGAQVIMVSSVSGHAQLLVPGFREKCIEAGLKDIILYLGGQLTIGRTPWEEVEKKYRDMGFDWVCPPNIMPAEVIRKLEADLILRRVTDANQKSEIN
ncbi:MAG: methylaspartate mutase subunit S [Dehalococcoidales bacterium]|nr:methylaspartate mutase subunit S [Dehalococcoidales bacterium]